MKDLVLEDSFAMEYHMKLKYMSNAKSPAALDMCTEMSALPLQGCQHDMVKGTEFMFPINFAVPTVSVHDLD